MKDEETNELIDVDLEGIYLKDDFAHSVKWKLVNYRTILGGKQTMHTCQNYTMKNALWLWAFQENLIYDNMGSIKIKRERDEISLQPPLL